MQKIMQVLVAAAKSTKDKELAHLAQEAIIEHAVTVGEANLNEPVIMLDTAMGIVVATNSGGRCQELFSIAFPTGIHHMGKDKERMTLAWMVSQSLNASSHLKSYCELGGVKYARDN